MLIKPVVNARFTRNESTPAARELWANIEAVAKRGVMADTQSDNMIDAALAARWLDDYKRHADDLREALFDAVRELLPVGASEDEVQDAAGWRVVQVQQRKEKAAGVGDG